MRVGKKNSPSFRLVVTPRRTAAKTGKFLEILGFYNPLQHTRAFKKERIQYWLSMGAQPSGTVHNLLVKEGISEGAKIAVHKRVKAKEETPEEAPKAGAKSDLAEEQKEPAASPPEADKQAGPPQSSEAGLGGETTPAEATVTPETKESEPETPESEPDSVEAKSDTAEEQAPEENVEKQEPASDEEKQVKE